MFPLYDENRFRTRRVVTLSLIVTNVVVFIGEFLFTSGFSDFDALGYMITTFGVTPAFFFEGVRVFDLGAISTVFTSMFLHGSLLHILGNMVFLYIFGDNVEAKFGHLRYLGLYLFFGLMGAIVHSLLAFAMGGDEALIPAVGASGAIAGVLGAYLVFFPHARIVTVIFVLFFIRIARIPAFAYLGIWFAYQFLFGAAGSLGGVAYWAHIGGFVGGVLAAFLLRPFSKRDEELL